MATDAQTLSNESACYQCAGVSLTEGMILALLAQVATEGISLATHYVVTASSLAPVAGAGDTITAQLVDVANNPILEAGRIVTWSYTGTDGSFSSATSVTNASGIATVTFTLDFANFPHVVTATDNHGLTGNTASITAVVGPYTAAWALQVVAFGGTNPTSLEQASADRYYRRCVTAGITNLFVSEILMISSSLIGATTPFLFAGAGGAVWVNNSNRFVIGDLTINGLHGNAVDKYLTTLLVPSVVQTSTSAGLVAYFYQTATLGSGYAMACSDNQNSNHFGLFVLTASTTAWCWRFINSGTDFTSGTTGRGFISMQRTAANALNLYWANSSNAFAAVGTASGVQTGAATTTDAVWLFNGNLLGGPAGPSDYLISYAAITLGMTSVQAQAHYNNVQQLRTDLGGGLV